jgi:pimeloyl-ACP methyl ester carboxylesterase
LGLDHLGTVPLDRPATRLSAMTVVAQAIEHDVPTRDGRTLHVYEAGDPAGQPVLVHHGTPGSGILAGSWATDAQAQGIRLIGYDRPGYGRSGRAAGRTVADVADDVTAILDALGIGRFRTWGVSGGGPHALACAALLSDRAESVASIASVAPYDAEGLDYLTGMGESNVDEFGAALEGEAALRPFLNAAAAEMATAGPDGLAVALESILPDVDVAALDGGFAQFMFEWMDVGLQPGLDGWLDDDLAFVAPWGFDLATIRTPLLLVHGRLDLMVPFSHGEWLAAHIPGVTPNLWDTEGHVSMVAQIPDVHSWLLRTVRT